MLRAPISEAAGRLPGPNEVLVTGPIITPEEQQVLVAWADEKCRAGRLLSNPEDPHSYLTPYLSADRALTRFTGRNPDDNGRTGQTLVWIPEVEFVDPLPEDFWRIRTRVIEHLGIHDLEEDHYKGSFLSYIAPGGAVHSHTDARLRIDDRDFHLLRCNVLFRRAKKGGLPVIGSTEVDVADRGMWVFFPTELFHSATEVHGSDYRGLLSFGFLVSDADLWRRRFRLARAVESQYRLDEGDEVREALIAQVKASAPAAGIGPERLELLELILRRAGDFSVEDIARSLERGASDVWETLHELQRSEFIESNSSATAAGGKVMVF